MTTPVCRLWARALALPTPRPLDGALISSCGLFCSDEQPGASVAHYLGCFQRLLPLGFTLKRWNHCSGGSAFKKPVQWLTNKPWYVSDIPSGCSCGFAGQHMRIGGTFTPDVLRRFEA
eukprot:8829813-Lingulodinium_polyedra.AAC.1